MIGIDTNILFAALVRHHAQHAKDFEEFGFSRVWNPLDAG